MRVVERGLAVCLTALTIVYVAATDAQAQAVPPPEFEAPVASVSGTEDGAESAQQIPLGVFLPPPELKRPRPLTSLYVSFAALQGLNAHSALPSVRGTADEMNPVVATYGTTPVKMLAIKAATTAGTIYLCEKLWRKNRAAALVVMIGLNSALAVATAHNYRVTEGRR